MITVIGNVQNKPLWGQGTAAVARDLQVNLQPSSGT